MVLCGTKNGSSMASLEEPLEAPLFSLVSHSQRRWGVRNRNLKRKTEGFESEVQCVADLIM